MTVPQHRADELPPGSVVGGQYSLFQRSWTHTNLWQQMGGHSMWPHSTIQKGLDQGHYRVLSVGPPMPYTEPIPAAVDHLDHDQLTLAAAVVSLLSHLDAKAERRIAAGGPRPAFMKLPRVKVEGLSTALDRVFPGVLTRVWAAKAAAGAPWNQLDPLAQLNVMRDLLAPGDDRG